jgi:tight adherence protein C
MTPVELLIGTALFLILLVVFLAVSKTQSSPQSAMLEEVDRQTRADRRKRNSENEGPSAYVEWLAKPLAALRRVISREPDANLVRRLSRAGYRQAAHADLFLASRFALPVLFALLVVALFSEGAFLFIIIAIVLGFFAPDFWLAQAIKRRRGRISDSLPDGLDLLSICMDAGLGLDQGIMRVGQEIRTVHVDLSQELLQIIFEQRAGMPRIDSWKAFAVRVDLDDLRQFVAMLVQTERFGTPIAQALATFSQSLRTRRRQAAEEMGAKAAIKMVFPMVLFIFPMVFIVTIGPAVIGLLKNLGTLLE